MMTMLKKFWNDEEGGHTVEWSLIAAIVAAVIVASWVVLGPQVKAALQAIANYLKDPSTATGL